MNTKLIFCLPLLLCINIKAYNQVLKYNGLLPAEIVMKTGDTLRLTGKLRWKDYRYKDSITDKKISIPFTEMETLKITDKSGNTSRFKFFSVKGKDKIRAYEELVVGKKISLYCDAFIIESSHPIGPVGQSGFSISLFGTHKIVKYYIRRPDETKLTKIGAYNTLFNELKHNLLPLFKDCELLLKRIKKKVYRYRREADIKTMFEVYNKQCD
ncbi:MAG: hypothetical protein ACK5H1_08950 [Tenacibaculum sp.]